MQIQKLINLIFFYVVVFGIAAFYIPKKPKNSINTNHFYSNSKGPDRVILLEDGFDSFVMRLDMIKKAKNTIDVCYYKIDSDEFSDIFLGALMQKAKEGVKVRILTNGIFKYIYKINSVFFGMDNIEIKNFNKPSIFRPWRFQNLCHDKILIIDDYAYMTGGRNIGERFFSKNSSEKTTVKDRDILVYNDSNNHESYVDVTKLDIEKNRIPNYFFSDLNSSVIGMKNYFNMLFNNKVSKHYKLKNRPEGITKRNEMISKYNDFEKCHTEIGNIDYSLKSHPTNKISIVHNELKNFNKYPEILQCIYSLSKNAKTVTIQSPYIVPTKYTNCFRTDINPDCKIKILTNSAYSSPNIVAIAGYIGRGKDKILKQAAQLYEYKGQGSIHAKSIIFDEHLSMVGTMNLDHRSSFLNSETVVFIDSESFTKELEANINNLYSQSELVSKNDNTTFKNIEHKKSVPLSKRLFIYILSILSHIIGVFI